ncbi:MAG: FAD binding domain-containing protein [Minwuia sp.]|nr:FAD binding domain-containing protein [Minwuia sp.]
MIDPVPRSRKRITPFRLHRPGTIDEAVTARAALPNSAFMGGGIDLLNGMKTGVEWTDVVLLRDIAELRAIRITGEYISIGSGVRLDELGRNDLVRDALPDVAAAWAPIANVRIRHQGTVGGNLMARKAHYDILPVLMATGATVVFATVDGAIELPAAWLSSSTKPAAFGALLTEVRIPAGARVLMHDRSHLPGFLITVGHNGDGAWHAAVAGAHDLPRVARLDLPTGADLPLQPALARRVAEEWCNGLPIMRERANISGVWRRRAVPVVLSRLLAGNATSRKASAA